MQSTITYTTTTHALKEWDVAVNALFNGKTIVLLRKGGIQEADGSFKVAYNQVLLYPTYEHQKPELLKPEYANRVTAVQSGWHPETIKISAWAEITDIFQISDAQKVAALQPYHIWNENFVSDRLKWKPRQPLYILLLRAYKLPQAQIIPYSQEYGGCKSWIDLLEPISIENLVPALSDAEYKKRLAEIHSLVED